VIHITVELTLLTTVTMFYQGTSHYVRTVYLRLKKYGYFNSTENKSEFVEVLFYD